MPDVAERLDRLETYLRSLIDKARRDGYKADWQNRTDAVGIYQQHEASLKYALRYAETGLLADEV